MRLIFQAVSIQTLDWTVWEVAISEAARWPILEDILGQVVRRAWFYSKYCLTQNGNVHIVMIWEGSPANLSLSSTWLTLAWPWCDLNCEISNFPTWQSAITLLHRQAVDANDACFISYRQIRNLSTCLTQNSSQYFPTF